MEWLCSGVNLVFYGLTMGLAFWYVAGLAWDWPAGLVGPVAGVAVVTVLAVAGAMVVGAYEYDGPALLTFVGIIGYPFGLLAGWAIMRKPLVGLVGGGLLLVLAVVVIASSVPHSERAGFAVFAPAMLLAGAGTLVVSAWLRLGGRHRIPALVPTAGDRNDARRHTS
jgi:hypothetical protein